MAKILTIIEKGRAVCKWRKIVKAFSLKYDKSLHREHTRLEDQLMLLLLQTVWLEIFQEVGWACLRIIIDRVQLASHLTMLFTRLRRMIRVDNA